MLKNKYFGIGGPVVGIILITMGGFLFWHGNKSDKAANNSQVPAVSADKSASSQSQTPDSSTAQPPASSTTAEPSVDPTKFTQYDKYKDGTAAQFAELKVGDGDQLSSGKKAAVLYKGWLTNGQLFDQSRADDKGQLQPFTLTLGAHEVISGWEQGLNGMQVGGSRLLIIPPSVGYGASGQGSIPPNSVLVFQVQLLAVQ